MLKSLSLIAFMMMVGTAAAAPTIKPIDPLQLRVENTENSLRRLEQRLNNQDSSLESIRTTIEHDMKEHKNNSNSDVDTLRTTSTSIVDDIKKLRDSLQKTNEALKKLSSDIDRLDKTVSKQAQEISNLKDAMSSVVDAMHVGSDSETVAYHKVENGDTLGSIAQQHHTSIKALKAVNDIKNDTIYVGQKLRLPPR